MERLADFKERLADFMFQYRTCNASFGLVLLATIAHHNGQDWLCVSLFVAAFSIDSYLGRP